MAVDNILTGLNDVQKVFMHNATSIFYKKRAKYMHYDTYISEKNKKQAMTYYDMYTLHAKCMKQTHFCIT